METNKIKQIITTSRSQTIHKRHQHNLNQVKDILQKDNLRVAKADKNKAIVIINKTMLEQKIQTFIQENGITTLPKYPTDHFHKQIQQAIQRCQTLIERNQQKCLLHIKPTAPQLNAYIKTHKEGEPICPVINNTQAPSYKIATFLNQKLLCLIDIPNVFNAKNSQEVARDLQNIPVNDNYRTISLDIKDLYVNLPT